MGGLPGRRRTRHPNPPAIQPCRSDLLRDATDLRDLTAAEEQELDETDADALRSTLWSSQSLHEQAEVLELLQRRFGAEAIETSPHGRSVTLQQLLEEVYHRGLRCQDWSVVRRCAGAMGMVHPQLEDALIDLLVRQKQVVVGRNYTADSRLSHPLDSSAIAERIARNQRRGQPRADARTGTAAGPGRRRATRSRAAEGHPHPAAESAAAAADVGAGSGTQLSQDEAFEALCSTSPHLIRDRLRQLLSDVEHARAALKRGEQLHVSGRVQWKVPDPLEQPPSGGDWLQHRIRLGSLQKVPRDFYAGIWSLLQHCRGLVIGDKLERRNRLNSRLILEKTAGERNFATLVEHLLSRIEAPEYRQLCTECLLSLMAFVEANPDVQFDDDLALDVVIGHAVRVGWQQTHPSIASESYSLHKAKAWGQFYAASPGDCRRWQIAALRELAEQQGLV